MSVTTNLGSPDPDFAAASRISPQTWALLIVLIATIVGWGGFTLANSAEIKDIKSQQQTAIERKADKDEVNRQYDQIMKRLDELREDVQEVRRNQQRSQR